MSIDTRGLSAIVLPDSRRLPSNIAVSAAGTSSSQLPTRHFQHRCPCNLLRQPPARGSRQSALKDLTSRLSLPDLAYGPWSAVLVRGIFSSSSSIGKP